MSKKRRQRRHTTTSSEANEDKNSLFYEKEGAEWPPKPEASSARTPAVPTQEAKGASSEDNQTEDSSEPSGEMTITGHLSELRLRLTRAVIGAFAGFLLCYGVAEDIFTILSRPLVNVMPQGTHFIYTGVAEGFFVYLKVALLAGIFIASPYIFYQLWAFIAPGLYKEERKHVLPLAIFSAFFFIVGALFCYFGVFPVAFKFFMSYSTESISAMPSLNEYLGFALMLLIAFGVVFEMPLFVYFLARIGIVTAQKMRRFRRYAVLGAFVIGALLTPPDVFSQLLMAGPMMLLYEISIMLAAAVGKKTDEKKKTA